MAQPAAERVLMKDKINLKQIVTGIVMRGFSLGARQIFACIRKANGFSGAKRH